MRGLKSWRNLTRKRQIYYVWGLCRSIKKTFMVVICTIMLYIAYRTTKFQNSHTKVFSLAYTGLRGLPHGIVEAKSDLELKPLWSTSYSRSMANGSGSHNLLAMPVGLKQKRNVNTIVQKFLQENFTIILFHYDGNMDGWWDLKWSKKAVHIVADNQTKWWFAKRFLHPAAISVYDYIFLWDEDLGVQHFNPRRYLDIVQQEGLEISQPALDPKSTDIHHRITVRRKRLKFHRRVYDSKGSVKCRRVSAGPPCTGFVEGMAPVFSRAAWHCAWHLIQNDLVHGWGMDMKLGYCAQGLRNVGIVDSEYVVHQGIQTLGGPAKKASNDVNLSKSHHRAMDMRTEHNLTRLCNCQKSKQPSDDLHMCLNDISSQDTYLKNSSLSICSYDLHKLDIDQHIRRQSTSELEIFKQRWEKAVREDSEWVDPFSRSKERHKQPTPTLDT